MPSVYASALQVQSVQAVVGLQLSSTHQSKLLVVLLLECLSIRGCSQSDHPYTFAWEPVLSG